MRPIPTFPECRPYVPPRVRARRTRRRVTLACAVAALVLAAGVATVRHVTERATGKIEYVRER